MRKCKVAISLEEEVLHQVDNLVAEKVFPNRSQAFQMALQEKIVRLGKNRLARECKKLNPKIEQQLAEEGMQEDFAQWPAY